MNKSKKLILSFSLIIIMFVLFFIFNTNTNIPEKLKTLDLSLTNNEFYINDENYEKEMDTIVIPYLKQYKNNGYFSSEDNINLYYESYILPETNDTIVISHGFTESTEKYEEVIYYFLKSGYSVFILDHRGHGNSTREVDDISLVYIDDFNDYVNDFKVFMDKIVTVQAPNNSYYLYAHSMGGGIGTRFLEDYPDYFDAAVLTTPMLGINTGYPKIISKPLSKAAVLINKGESYVFGHSAFNSTRDFNISAGNSEKRYNYYFDKMLENENLQTSGASFAWLNAALNGADEALEKDNLDNIKIPVLLFQAANDDLVLPESQYKFAEEVESCEIILVENSKHEIYNSDTKDSIPYFNTIFQFLESNK